MDVVDEEFSLFDPQHLSLLKERMSSYFRALDHRKSTIGLGRTLMEAMAVCVGDSDNLQWGSEAFDEAVAFFLTELVLPVASR